MISLEQIRSLETKVHKAVSMLTAVQEENQLLRSKLGACENRVEELEFMIEEFKEDQSEIEQGIISALNHLDHLEDAVGGLKTGTQSAETAAPILDEAPVIAVAAKAVTADEPAPAIAEWEVPTQVFEQPAPEQTEPYEAALPEAEPEAVPERNQQLDIF